MKPNISRAGRIARVISGLVCVLAGVMLWLLGWPSSTTWRWIAIVFLIAAGLFQLFEAKRGWCAVRACGVKTPL
jgi:hypothetical protein